MSRNMSRNLSTNTNMFLNIRNMFRNMFLIVFLVAFSAHLFFSRDAALNNLNIPNMILNMIPNNLNITTLLRSPHSPHSPCSQYSLYMPKYLVSMKVCFSKFHFATTVLLLLFSNPFNYLHLFRFPINFPHQNHIK